MPEFHYRARNFDGAVIDGSVTTSSRATAIAMVEALGAIPISIRSNDAPAPAAQTGTQAPDKPGETSLGSSDRLSFKHQNLFTEQLAHLLGAGLTLDESLGILAQRLRHPGLRSLSQNLHKALVDGRSLSQALAEYPRIFSPLYVNLVSAGEASGALPKILMRLSEHLSTLQGLRDKVQGALVYPMVLVVAGIGLIVTFMTVMVPRITSFFSGTGQPLPAATQLLININQAIVHYWWAVPVGGFLGYGAYRAITQSADGRLAWDTMMWRIPVFSRITRYRFFVQFSQTLGTLCENGLTMLRALELLEEISGNAYVRARTQAARQAVIDGAALSVALRAQNLFPELFLDMVAVGEQTGRLAETMLHITTVYDRELNKQVEFVTTLIPPMVMVVIAAVVGLVVYGIMSAVFGLTANLHVQMH
ncbi:MAG TPA: type II secretion system F family protein [Chthoniobacter sp.]|jgi:type II secretory pathway component PulF